MNRSGHLVAHKVIGSRRVGRSHQLASTPITETFVPSELYCSRLKSVGETRDIIRGGQFCYANFGYEYMDQLPDSREYIIIHADDECDSNDKFGDIDIDDIVSTQPQANQETQSGNRDTILVPQLDKLRPQNQSLNKSNRKSSSSSSTSPNPPTNNGGTDLSKPPSAPTLTQQMQLLSIAAMRAGKDAVIVNDNPFKLTKGELTCLEPREWLHDNVVDYYLELIARRNRINDGKYAKIHAFRSTFYTLLEAEGLKAVEESAEGVNIFSHELIFFPVCQSDHWRLVVVNTRDETVTCYNSSKWTPVHNVLPYFAPDKTIVDKIVSYLNDEYKRVYIKADSSKSCPEWKISLNLDNIPKQDNADDCGIYVLQFAEYLSRRAAFDFNADHILYFRQRMLYECITKGLLEQ